MLAQADTRFDVNEYMLQQIFPNRQFTLSTVLKRTTLKAIRVIKFDHYIDEYKDDRVVVRVERTNDHRFGEVAAFQQLGAIAAPEMVPTTYDIGKVKCSNGQVLQYSVAQFVPGVDLDQIWHLITWDNKCQIMDDLVSAMKKFWRSTPETPESQEMLKDTALLVQPHLQFGGPMFGFFDSGLTFIKFIVKKMEPDQDRISISDDGRGGLRIKPSYPDHSRLESVHFLREDLVELEDMAVLCHNDLIPQNLMVQLVEQRDGRAWYKLAAIIDWEFASFVPAAYEVFYKEQELGLINPYYDWYFLFRQKTMQLLPNPLKPSQAKLFKTMEMARMSHLARTTSNFNHRLQQRFLKRYKLVHDGFEEGWVSKLLDEQFLNFGEKEKKELDDLIEEVRKEVGFYGSTQIEEYC
jgi:thiamine kinase-like enzyme